MIAALCLAWFGAALAATGTLAWQRAAARRLARCQRLAAVVALLPRCDRCGELARWRADDRLAAPLGPRCDACRPRVPAGAKDPMVEFGHACALRELRADDLPGGAEAGKGVAPSEHRPRILGRDVEGPARSARGPAVRVLSQEQERDPASQSGDRLRLPRLYDPRDERDERDGSELTAKSRLPTLVREDEQETRPFRRTEVNRLLSGSARRAGR